MWSERGNDMAGACEAVGPRRFDVCLTGVKFGVVKHEPIAVPQIDRPHGRVAAVGVALVAACVVFYRLGSSPVFWWDEARVAINSLEMMRHPGLVVTYQGQPDLWNTKPPLAIWLNALSMGLFGVNEWALRLPSALASVGTVVSVYAFAKRIADQRTGLLAALILLGIGGFIEVHVARSADFDALLVLFTTLTVFSVYRRAYWLAAACFAGAVLTKGIAGAMMAPALLAFVIYWKDIRKALIPGIAATSVIALFYVARELANPGYIAAVWNSDVMRYGVPAEGNAGPRSAYLLSLFNPWQLTLAFPWAKPLYTASAFPWSFVALLALWRPSKAAAYLFCCAGVFLLIVSLAATRLGWYIAPLYPLIAVLAALAVRRWFWLAVPLALVCVGFNVWKMEKTAQLPQQHFMYITPDGKAYGGPDEFYQSVT